MQHGKPGMFNLFGSNPPPLAANDSIRFGFDTPRLAAGLFIESSMITLLISRFRNNARGGTPLLSRSPAVTFARALGLVRLDVAAKLVHVILKLAFGGVEGVAQSHINIFMVVAVYHDFIARYADVYAHIELLPPVMVMVRRLHHHTAGHDMFKKLVELRRLVPYAFFKRFGMVGATVGNLQWYLHGFPPKSEPG